MSKCSLGDARRRTYGRGTAGLNPAYLPRQVSAEVETVHLAEGPQVPAQRLPYPLLRIRARDDARWIVKVSGEVWPLDHLREKQGPRARHHLVDRISPTPQCQPPALAQLVRELVENLPHARPDARRRRDVGQRIQVVRVATVLRHENRRLESAQHRRHHPLESLQPGFVPGERLEGKVRRGASPLPHAAILRKSGARKEVSAALVKADREHVRIRVKNVLDTIAVMNIDVDVGDAMASILEPPARDGRVVVRAEPRREPAMRVMQAARRAEDVERRPALDGLGPDPRRPPDPRRTLVQLV